MGINKYVPISIQREISGWLKFLKGKKSLEEMKLNRQPRFESGTTGLIQPRIEYVDAASLLSAYEQIFKQEIYNFKSDTKPRIIDCGANIGLAIIYWKKRFPNAEIIAFEPDPTIFEVLKRNIQTHKYSDVFLYQKGVSVKEDSISFYQEGADGGYLVRDHKNKEDENIITVPVIDLKKFLDQPVDMLKIDIEGAEVDVITNCEKELENVDNLFVEYHSYLNKEQSLDKLLSSLKKAGFRYHIHPELIVEQPFVEEVNNDGMDHRLNIFAYRV